jgi:hypothetical protein
MAFPEAAANQLLVACKRHCCVCWRRCGFRIELHHIKPKAEGGADDIDNAIPVCFDCHAEIESTGPRGRRFKEHELQEHRRSWLALVGSNPAALIAAAQQQSETGPLEALLAELEYNLTIASGHPEEGFPPFATRQFERSIATNALATLPDGVRKRVHYVYVAIQRVNYHLQEMISVDRTGGRGSAFAATQVIAKQLRHDLIGNIGRVIAEVNGVLGRAEVDPAAPV